MTIPTVINSAWVFALVFAFVAVGAASYFGWRKYKDEIFWRWIKLFASIAAALGIGVALMNFDVAARALWKDEVQQEVILEYIDARTALAMSMAKICSEAAALPSEKNTCWDLKNIGGQIASTNLRHRRPLAHITNWQKNPSIDEEIRLVNIRIDWINRNMAIPANEHQIVDPSTRPWILLIAALLFALAAAGTIGEAAFQLRLAKDRNQ